MNVDAGWSSPVARRAHNPKVAGSNPAPATKKSSWPVFRPFAFYGYNIQAYHASAAFCRPRLRSSVVEQRTHKPLVAGSNPAAATSNYLIQLG